MDHKILKTHISEEVAVRWNLNRNKDEKEKKMGKGLVVVVIFFYKVIKGRKKNRILKIPQFMIFIKTSKIILH